MYTGDSDVPHHRLSERDTLVLVVASSGHRRTLLSRCVLLEAPGSRIEVADSYFDAMAHATRMPAHLLVLDLALDSVLMPALRRFLESAAPQVLVHVFDDSIDPVDHNGQPLLHEDGPSMLLLRAAVQAFAAGQPVAPAQRPPRGDVAA